MTIDTIDDWNDQIGFRGGCGPINCFMPSIDLSLEYETATPCGYGIGHASASNADSRVVYKTMTTTFIDDRVDGYITYHRNQRSVVDKIRNESFVCFESLVSSSSDIVLEHNHGTSYESFTWASSYTSGSCSGTYAYHWEGRTNPPTQPDVDTTEDWNEGFQGWSSLGGAFTSPATITATAGDGVITNTFSEPIAPSDLVFPDDLTGQGSSSATTAMPQRGGGWNVLRYRFFIPAANTVHRSMTYCKITWDMLFEPLGDPDNSEFLEEGLTVEWTGPGNNSDPTGESWMTPWNTLLPPDEPGEHRVVNVRYEFFRSKYGTKPVVVGEAWEPAPPA